MTDLSLQVKATGSLIGTSSYQIVLDCPRVRFNGTGVQVGVSTFPVGLAQLPAYPDASAVHGAKVTLVNITSGY